MGNLLYAVAVILVIIWAIGFFGYAAGGIIHVLLVIAIVLFLLKFIRRKLDRSDQKTKRSADPAWILCLCGSEIYIKVRISFVF